MTSSRRIERATTPRVLFAAVRTAACVLALLSLTTGCTQSKTAATAPNFTQTLNAHFLDRKECLLEATRFPFETTDKQKTKQMDSLVKALLLHKDEEMSIHASRYTPTETGARFAPRFCYGHREVTGVDSFTPLATANGFKESTVTYRYTIQEVPVWAKTPEVMAAFPEMARAITAESTDKATLAQTIAGWTVPD